MVGRDPPSQVLRRDGRLNIRVLDLKLGAAPAAEEWKAGHAAGRFA